MTMVTATRKSKKSKVFIVDDHPLLRDGITQLINQQEDLEVCGEAEDIPQALEAISEIHPDIAIVDLSLGSGSGLRLLDNLKYSHPDLPTIVLSMHDETLYAERCLRAGAKGYIMKRESPTKVVDALKIVLNGEIYTSEDIKAKLLRNLVSSNVSAYNSPVDLLTTRELEVFQLLGKGQKKRAIAEKLNLSVKTVENYVEHIKKKLNLKGTHEVITHAFTFVSEAEK